MTRRRLSTRARHLGQPERNLWKDDDQDHRDQTATDEGQGRPIDIAHCGAFRGDALHHEEAQTERRGYAGDLDVDQIGSQGGN